MDDNKIFLKVKRDYNVMLSHRECAEIHSRITYIQKHGVFGSAKSMVEEQILKLLKEKGLR